MLCKHEGIYIPSIMPGTNAGRRCHRGALRHALVKPSSVLPSLDIKEFLPHATGKIDSITPYHFCGLRRAMWLVQNSPPTAHQEVHMRRVALPLTNEESSWTAALSNVNLIWESSSRANTAVCRPSFEKKNKFICHRAANSLMFASSALLESSFSFSGWPFDVQF